MAVNNKTLEINGKSLQYVLIVKKDGVNKYIAKNFYSCRMVNCTVLIKKAKRFISRESALNLFNDMKLIDESLKLVKVATIELEYKITELGDE